MEDAWSIRIPSLDEKEEIDLEQKYANISHLYHVALGGDLCRLSKKNLPQSTKFIPYLIAPVILLVAFGIVAALLGTVFKPSSTITSEKSKIFVVQILSPSCFSDHFDNNHDNHK
jgi:hypothetical protein